MKKILLLMAIILPFVLTSCGDDKDEPKQTLEQELIGGWIYNNYVIYVFNADHTGFENRLNSDGNINEHNPFTWKLNGKMLNIKDSDGNDDTYEISIKNNILYLNEDGGTYEFHRAMG